MNKKDGTSEYIFKLPNPHLINDCHAIPTLYLLAKKIYIDPHIYYVCTMPKRSDEGKYLVASGKNDNLLVIS